MKCRVALLTLVLSLLLSAALASASPLFSDAPGAPSLPRNTVFQYQQDGIPYYVYIPSTAPASGKLTTLLAIHGYGEDARGFVGRMTPKADWYGWMLVAPDLPSGDWKDFQVIQSDARRNLPWLHRLVQGLPGVVGSPVDGRVLLYGFSLGAQTGHRFALAYPEDVKAAAVMSAGTYTLPLQEVGEDKPLAFPLGTSDLDRYSARVFDRYALRNTHFWVGVGEADAAPADVPREFDGYEGNCRKERAVSFARSLWSLGVPTEFETFPDQAHWETPASLDAAAGFLFRVSQVE